MQKIRLSSGRQFLETLSFLCLCEESPMHTDKAHTHIDTYGRLLSDGHWPRAVVMLGDFSFLLHWELSFLFLLCCHAAVNTIPVRFTFKSLHLAPPHLFSLSLPLFLFIFSSQPFLGTQSVVHIPLAY